MKKIIIVVITLFIIFSLTSCATIYAKRIDDMMKSWIGDTKQHLLQKWGPPTDIFDNGEDGEIWTYSFYRQTTGYATKTNRGNIFWRAPQQYEAVRQFYIDKDGLIFAYRWQGL